MRIDESSEHNFFYLREYITFVQDMLCFFSWKLVNLANYNWDGTTFKQHNITYEYNIPSQSGELIIWEEMYFKGWRGS